MQINLFSPESRFYRFMSRIGDFILLNFLWLLTSIPIVTIGASTTALYAVMFRVSEKKEGYLTINFFREFKRNFRQITPVWLILFCICGMMITDLLIMGMLRGKVNETMGGILVGVVTMIFLLALLTLLYLFPMQARYENGRFETLYKSFVFSIRYFGYTFQMVGVLLMPLGITLILGMLTGKGYSWCVLFYLLMGVSVTAYWMVKGPVKGLTKKLEVHS